jgi:glutathione synthase/RimK-type ligase-like ATP-grasp enzyme
MQIAIATCDEFPDLHISAQQILEPLRRRGLHPEPRIWNDERINWQEYDAVLLRSVWDYHRHIDAFRAWLNHLETLGVPVWNPPQLLRWNLDKRYLTQLAAHDVPVPPTVFIEDSETSLLEILQDNDWLRAVVKPVISAGGDDTWQTSRHNAATDQPRFEQLVQRVAVMVQPFMPQIAQGEWSLLYFNGMYSHALLKVPGQNQMFVHAERGGSTRQMSPPVDFIVQGSRAVRLVEQLTGVCPLYARVDGVVQDGRLCLMELECVEPELFFQHTGYDAPERFADALWQRIKAL